MGLRYFISVICPKCGRIEDDVYYAPTCGFTDWKCTCGEKVDLEKYTGIGAEEASNAKEIDAAIREGSKMYQVCTCPQSNLTVGDPNCPIHGKQPESVTFSWCPSCALKDAEIAAGAHLVATVGDKNRELENGITRLRSRCEKLEKAREDIRIAFTRMNPSSPCKEIVVIRRSAYDEIRAALSALKGGKA